MKMLQIITRPPRLDDVIEALRQHGVHGLTITDVTGCGKQRGRTERYRGAEYTIQLQPKVKIETVVPDEGVEELIRAVAQAARTGEVGDGKIFVFNVEEALRIRTGEKGEEAV